MTNDKRKGWGWPPRANKIHYFVGYRSLCRTWTFTGKLESSIEPGANVCQKCARKLKERQEDAEEEAQEEHRAVMQERLRHWGLLDKSSKLLYN